MKKEMKKLVDEYNKLETQIFEKFSNLPEFSEECKCEDCETFDYIHHGDWKEIQTFCLNCGGYIENG